MPRLCTVRSGMTIRGRVAVEKYKVIWFKANSPLELEQFLNNMYSDNGWNFIGVNGDYFIFFDTKFGR